jgi:putative membrane protein
MVPPLEVAMTRWFLMCCCVGALVTAGPLAAQVEDPLPNRAQPMNEAAFLRNAATTGQADLDLAELAQVRSQDEGVKALASKIKLERQQTAIDLKTLAGSKHVNLPVPVGLDKMTRDEFTKLSGALFDRAYLDRTVQDHRRTIAIFIQASASPDEDVRAFANKVLPTLTDHQRQAEELQKQFGERAKAQ